jgi:hypothetical protein
MFSIFAVFGCVVTVAIFALSLHQNKQSLEYVEVAHLRKLADTRKDPTGTYMSLSSLTSSCGALSHLFRKRSMEDVYNLRTIKFKDAIHYPDRKEILRLLYYDEDGDPYANLTEHHQSAGAVFPSSAANSRAGFEAAILKYQGEYPKVIVEVGTFLGSGIVGAWAPIATLGGGVVIAVDTWLGDANMRLSTVFKPYIDLKHGK